MPVEVKVTKLECSHCQGMFSLNDLRSLHGEVVCRRCFDSAKDEDAPASEGGRKKPRLRLKGQSRALVWTMPKESLSICGFTEDKSVLYAAQIDPDMLDKTAATLGEGAEPENVFGSNFLRVPVTDVQGAETGARSNSLNIHYAAAGAPQSLSLTLSSLAEKNQVFVELAGGLGDAFACQTEFTKDWSGVNRLPIVLAVVALFLAIVGAGVCTQVAKGLVIPVGAGGLVLFLVFLVWAAVGVFGAPKRPVRMTLAPTG